MTTAEITGAAVASIAPAPLVVLAQAGTGSPAVYVPVWAISLVVTLMVGAIGFFLKRALEQVDRRLEKLDAHFVEHVRSQARLEERVANIESHVGRLTDTKE
jgi:hypothetical protein